MTVGEFVDDELGIPQGTAYGYVKRLETAGLVKRVTESRSYEYGAEAISLALSVDGATVTPALIAAIGRIGADEDVEVYVDRHDLDGLAAALEYAFERVEGTVTHRTVARELDPSPLEAEIMMQARGRLGTGDSTSES